MRYLASGFWLLAGTMHFVIPKSYEATVPPQSPVPPKEAVAISGVAEIAGDVATEAEDQRPRENDCQE